MTLGNMRELCPAPGELFGTKKDPAAGAIQRGQNSVTEGGRRPRVIGDRTTLFVTEFRLATTRTNHSPCHMVNGLD
jgi:hypothetical protein